jgi:glycosyltransferase involved in cell wall biosynthesis
MNPLSLISIVIPARDEEGALPSTIKHLHLELSLRGVPHEIIVVDDGSTDRTWEILQQEAAKIPELRPIQNKGLHGFGRAIIMGLDAMQGDAVVIMMADESDDCRDVVRYWEKLNEGYDCVFGSRFMRGGGTIDYPAVKYALNRMANAFIRVLFQHGLNDTTGIDFSDSKRLDTVVQEGSLSILKVSATSAIDPINQSQTHLTSPDGTPTEETDFAFPMIIPFFPPRIQIPLVD